MFKTDCLSPYWLQTKFSMSLFFYVITFAINLWHRKLVTADVTAAFVNNQHDIWRQVQDFNKKFVFEGVHSKEVVRRISEVSNCLKCNLFAFSSISAEYLQKICIFNSQGSVATFLRWGGYCCMGFVAHFIRFPSVQKFWKSVKIWQSYGEFKGGNFFETQRSSVHHA